MKMITRRELLKLIGIGAVSGLFAAEISTAESGVKKTSHPKCVLTPEQTAGPFYFDVEKCIGRNLVKQEIIISLEIFIISFINLKLIASYQMLLIYLGIKRVGNFKVSRCKIFSM